MRYLIIFLLIVSLVLTILIVRQNKEIKDIRDQVSKCRADILQWSKLAQYSAEFHAIPDSTAPFDTLLSRKDGTLFYSKRVENGIWFIQKLPCGDSMGCFIPDPPYVFEGDSIRITRTGDYTFDRGKLILINGKENKVRQTTIGNNPDTSHYPLDNMTFKYKPYYLSDRMWPDDRDKKTRATKVIDSKEGYEMIKYYDKSGNLTTFINRNGKWTIE